MTRAEGWRFLDMGRKLERSMHMVALLKGTMVRAIPQEGAVLDAVLEVADSGMTYRRRYLGSLCVEAVLDLLVFDETNPRSLASQLAALEDDVNHIPRPNHGAGRAVEQRQTLAGLSAVRLAEAEKLAAIQDGEPGPAATARRTPGHPAGALRCHHAGVPEPPADVAAHGR